MLGVLKIVLTTENAVRKELKESLTTKFPLLGANDVEFVKVRDKAVSDPLFKVDWDREPSVVVRSQSRAYPAFSCVICIRLALASQNIYIFALTSVS